MLRSEWGRIAKRVNALWPSQPWAPDTIDAYYDELKEFDASVVAVVLSRYAREDDSTFPPSAGRLFSETKGLTRIRDEMDEWENVIPVERQLPDAPPESEDGKPLPRNLDEMREWMRDRFKPPEEDE